MADERARRGLRGYIASRPVRGTSFPQRIQNLAVRNYAAQLGAPFQLSATEYAMPGCFMMLVAILEDLAALDGIIAFSCFMLPPQKHRRLAIYDSILQAGTQLHSALENLTLQTADDIARWEDLMDVSAVLPATPFGGRYEKNGTRLEPRLVRAFAAGSALDR